MTMSTHDSVPEDLEIDERVEKRMRLSRALSEAGYADVLVLSHESGRKILTSNRLEILDRLREGSVESVRALAAELGRDKGGVSRDLKLLAERDVIEYDDTGRAKAPQLKHDTVVVEPIE